MNTSIVMIDIAQWWTSAYPIIEVIANVTGALTGVAAVVAAPIVSIKWLRDIVNRGGRDRPNEEYNRIRRVLKRHTWNVTELSEQLDIPKECAKDLLRGFGYIWDSKRMLYIASENTERLIYKLLEFD